MSSKGMRAYLYMKWIRETEPYRSCAVKARRHAIPEILCVYAALRDPKIREKAMQHLSAIITSKTEVVRDVKKAVDDWKLLDRLLRECGA